MADGCGIETYPEHLVLNRPHLTRTVTNFECARSKWVAVPSSVHQRDLLIRMMSGVRVTRRPRLHTGTSCLFAEFGTQFWAGVETMCQRKMSESGENHCVTVLELCLSSYIAGPWFLMSLAKLTELLRIDDETINEKQCNHLLTSDEIDRLTNDEHELWCS